MSEPNWAWWMSEDEERWFGPHATKELAIAAGEAMCAEGESFHICEAYKQTYTDLYVDAEGVLEAVAEAYEDLSDPEGNGLFSSKIPLNLMRELDTELSEALHRWIKRHEIEVGIYNFANSRNEERIDREPPEAA